MNAKERGSIEMIPVMKLLMPSPIMKSSLCGKQYPKGTL